MRLESDRDRRGLCEEAGQTSRRRADTASRNGRQTPWSAPREPFRNAGPGAPGVPGPAARVYARGVTDSRPEPPHQYRIQGRVVAMPVEVRDASAGVATWLLPARAVQRLVPDGFDVATVLPGRTPVAIAVIDYRDNDLGDYHEVSITCFVQPRGTRSGIPWLGSLVDLVRGRLGTYIWKLPVDQSFTCEAGRVIWGFPKTVESIDFQIQDDLVRCRLSMDGKHVLTLSLPRGGTRTLPESDLATYTQIEGIPHRTRFRQGGRGVGFRLGGARLELGTHAIADTLRSLGLPGPALMTMWTEHLHGRFDAPEKL